MDPREASASLLSLKLAGKYKAYPSAVTRPGCARMDRLAIGPQVANLPHNKHKDIPESLLGDAGFL
jgi:hypothetical protein